MTTENPPTITLTNNSNEAVVVQTQSLAPNGGSYTWLATDLAEVCQDINFWCAFLTGEMDLNINGYDFTMSSFGIVELLIQMGMGNIG